VASSLDFGWHDGKAAANVAKHRLRFDRAVAVFADPTVSTSMCRGQKTVSFVVKPLVGWTVG
jgi:uncharacterized DUF497 family protein